MGPLARKPFGEVRPIKLGGFTLTAEGLTVTGTPGYEEWVQVGIFAGHSFHASAWWLVDWLTYGESQQDWVDRCEQAIAETGLALQTIKNLRSLRRVPHEVRDPTLGIDKHAEVSRLSVPEQREWLARCKEEGWTRIELREKMREAHRPRVVEGVAPLRGRYRVVYADPPWRYRDSADTTHGRVENHYPTLSVEQIMKLPVAAHVEKDAVLWLWSTAPLLLENPGPRDVIEAWGFRYVENYVWHKVLGMPGRYSRVVHEHLLIGVRGHPAQNVKAEKRESVIVERRSRKHSEKPDSFRLMIEELYPEGPRLMMFGRAKVEGWTVWGNDANVVDPEGGVA